MTATLPRRPPDRPPAGHRPDQAQHPARPPGRAHSNSIRTLQALAGGALGIVPLQQMFTDLGWLVEAWLTMAIVIVPAALLRLRARPSGAHLLPGLVLGAIWITARLVPDHAIGGLLPWRGAWNDAGALLTQLHDTVDDGVAPLHTTPAILFVLFVSVGLLAAVIDLIAVVARRGALAGVPLLVVYTVSGAVPRHPVGWVSFVCAAAGYLLLLGLDASDDVRSWGRFMPRAGVSRSGRALGVSGQRIAIIAIAAALLLPLVAPSTTSNVIANAFHHGGGNASGTGGFQANGVSLDPFAGLRGSLSRPKPINLFNVTVGSGADSAQPGYLVANVLQNYTSRGWIASDHGVTLPLDAGYPLFPADGMDATDQSFTAGISIDALHDNPPTFGRPVSTSGLPSSCRWAAEDAILIGCTVRAGATYSEQVAQPAPTIAQLDAAPNHYTSDLDASLQYPSMPAKVTNLVRQLTHGIASPYRRALALQDYFTDPDNGFTYSLRTKSGDSGSDLVDFLTNKTGYCQQYAAAMGIMLRMAGVPARVVLGYMHPAPDSSGQFTVTTSDAHAWVEAFFTGVGWIPMDPTPLVGIDGGASADLPWAPHAVGTGAGQATGTEPNPHQTLNPSGNPTSSTPAVSAASTGTPADRWPMMWAVLAVLVVVVLLLLPAGVRLRRRRNRLRAGRHGDPDPLWAELSATALDLGYVWSPARSPRQVVAWIDRHAGAPSPSLAGLATAVELSRYAPNPAPADAAAWTAALHDAEDRLRARRGAAERLRSRLLPASLGWRWLRLPWLGRGGRRR